MQTNNNETYTIKNNQNQNHANNQNTNKFAKQDNDFHWKFLSKISLI